MFGDARDSGCSTTFYPTLDLCAFPFTHIHTSLLDTVRSYYIDPYTGRPTDTRPALSSRPVQPTSYYIDPYTGLPVESLEGLFGALPDPSVLTTELPPVEVYYIDPLTGARMSEEEFNNRSGRAPPPPPALMPPPVASPVAAPEEVDDGSGLAGPLVVPTPPKGSKRPSLKRNVTDLRLYKNASRRRNRTSAA